MKYFILIFALAICSCDSEPISEPASTTRAVTNDTIPSGGITLEVDTAWTGEFVIKY